ncbi:MAG: hypothetical protein HKM24_01985, partial [Gammaproteobacteria bacterium]|nr:hypothetical protein [Gammaproteobacteria bacterium]
RNRLSRINAAGSITELVFDAVGNLRFNTDANGNTTEHRYDALNRLTETIDALNDKAQSTRLVYDVHDNVTSLEAPNGAMTSYQFDDFGNLLEEQSSDRGVYQYRYDEAGNRIVTIDPRGVTVNYSYDALNRLIGIDYPNDARNVTYEYDLGQNGIGRMTGFSDHSGQTALTYNIFGELKYQQQWINGELFELTYRYDQNGQLIEMIYPSGRSVYYDYNELGEVAAIQVIIDGVAHSVIDGLSYQPFGPVKTMTFGNGLVESRQHDQQYRLTNLTTPSVMSRAYHYDAVGNVIGIDDLSNPDQQKNFDYDELHRLEQAAGVTFGSVNFSYDPNGNRISKLNADGLVDLSYHDDSNKLKNITGILNRDYRHNAAGNIAAAGDWVFNYDQRGYMTVAENVVTNKRSTYYYNAKNQRVRVRFPNNNQRYFVYSSLGQLLSETSGDGDVIWEHIYLNGVPVAAMTNSNIFFVHSDHLGTPQKLSDATQTVRWHAHYMPFGQASITSSLHKKYNLRYPGQYYDRHTGLHYNWHRYYDPDTGRYLQSDPIGLAAGKNTYLYVGANPNKWSDPLGLFSIPKISGEWVRAPAVTDLDIDYLGYHLEIGNWKWIPPGIQLAVIDFYGSARVSFSIRCKKETDCDSTTWMFSPNFRTGLNIRIPQRQSIIGHPVVTVAKISKASLEAYDLLQHWAEAKLAYYVASSPLTWCLASLAADL